MALKDSTNIQSSTNKGRTLYKADMDYTASMSLSYLSTYHISFFLLQVLSTLDPSGAIILQLSYNRDFLASTLWRFFTLVGWTTLTFCKLIFDDRFIFACTSSSDIAHDLSELDFEQFVDEDASDVFESLYSILRIHRVNMHEMMDSRKFCLESDETSWYEDTIFSKIWVAMQASHAAYSIWCSDRFWTAQSLHRTSGDLSIDMFKYIWANERRPSWYLCFSSLSRFKRQ